MVPSKKRILLKLGAISRINQKRSQLIFQKKNVGGTKHIILESFPNYRLILVDEEKKSKETEEAGIKIIC